MYNTSSRDFRQRPRKTATLLKPSVQGPSTALKSLNLAEEKSFYIEIDSFQLREDVISNQLHSFTHCPNEGWGWGAFAKTVLDLPSF